MRLPQDILAPISPQLALQVGTEHIRRKNSCLISTQARTSPRLRSTTTNHRAPPLIQHTRRPKARDTSQVTRTSLKSSALHTAIHCRHQVPARSTRALQAKVEPLVYCKPDENWIIDNKKEGRGGIFEGNQGSCAHLGGRADTENNTTVYLL